jgi:histidyl-tRNA synthetase
MAADAEICMMAADTMEKLGIERGQYVVKVNNRKILDGILEAIDLGGDKNAHRRLTVLRAFDKYDRLGDAGVQQLLGNGRWDGGMEGKGDFTKGAGLDVQQIGTLIQVVGAGNMSWAPVGSDLDLPTADEIVVSKDFLPGGPLNNPTAPDRYFYSSQGLIDRWAYHLKGIPVGEDGIDELSTILKLSNASGYGSRRIMIDAGVVRGLEYYTGPVYEVELLLDTKDEKGRPVRFGSVGGGGRYDGLVSRFRGEPVPATGFSIGVSRLQAALTQLGKLDNKPAPGPVLVTVFDRDRVADYQKMVAALRNAGIRAELYLGNVKHSVGQQLRYADKRNSPCAIIQGSDEKARGELQIRDLILGGAPSDIADREGYLKKQAEAQFAVPVDNLVEAVNRVLTRHGIAWT